VDDKQRDRRGNLAIEDNRTAAFDDRATFWIGVVGSRVVYVLPVVIVAIRHG
jgi:hypothetical protein